MNTPLLNRINANLIREDEMRKAMEFYREVRENDQRRLDKQAHA